VQDETKKNKVVQIWPKNPQKDFMIAISAIFDSQKHFF
jgi:hypothetical protein